MSRVCSASGSRGIRGIALLELIVFIMIIGVAMGGIMIIYRDASVNSAQGLVRKQAITLAQGVLDEVMARSYQPDGNGNPSVLANTVTIGQQRTSVHDISDYNGFSNGLGTFYSFDGSAMPGITRYSVNVTVDPLSTFAGLACTVCKLVTVVVSGPANTQVTLQGVKIETGARCGGLHSTPPNPTGPCLAIDMP